jgi:SAM-dependent methyltransferase
MSDSPTKLYAELADWWPLLSAPADYAEEAGFYRRILDEACRPRTVLELGSGGGNNASHLKQHFSLTLVDRSPEMLAVSRRLNPEGAALSRMGSRRRYSRRRVYRRLRHHAARQGRTSAYRP